VRGRRRACAPDATGRAEWRFCCSSGAACTAARSWRPLIAHCDCAAGPLRVPPVHI
jgi:hypothetical protein